MYIPDFSFGFSYVSCCLYLCNVHSFIVVKCDNYSALGERSMFLVKINVRETEGAISNVHHKDTGNNKRKRNRRGNQQCTLQGYRQQ
jgi:hypothetical protein